MGGRKLTLLLWDVVLMRGLNAILLVGDSSHLFGVLVCLILILCVKHTITAFLSHFVGTHFQPCKASVFSNMSCCFLEYMYFPGSESCDLRLFTTITL